MVSLAFAATLQQMAMAEDLVVRSDDPPKVISVSPVEKYQIATIQGTHNAHSRHICRAAPTPRLRHLPLLRLSKPR